jgi:hypothetical protein
MRWLAQVWRVLLTGLIEGSCVYGWSTAGHHPTQAQRAVREGRINACVRRGLGEIDEYLTEPAARS